LGKLLNLLTGKVKLIDWKLKFSLWAAPREGTFSSQLNIYLMGIICRGNLVSGVCYWFLLVICQMLVLFNAIVYGWSLSSILCSKKEDMLVLELVFLNIVFAIFCHLLLPFLLEVCVNELVLLLTCLDSQVLLTSVRSSVPWETKELSVYIQLTAFASLVLVDQLFPIIRLWLCTFCFFYLVL